MTAEAYLICNNVKIYAIVIFTTDILANIAENESTRNPIPKPHPPIYVFINDDGLQVLHVKNKIFILKA